jgi:hypothetical protein
MFKNAQTAGYTLPREGPRQYAVERFIDIVWRAVASREDPNTLDLLAVIGGTSRSPLKTLSKTLGILPRDARDFTRLFRVFAIAFGDTNEFHNLLNIAEPDTMAKLFRRAGLTYPTMLSPFEFLDRQRLVHNEHVLKALKELVEKQPGT